jgi:L-threonylcarbamoyladenylate synthase
MRTLQETDASALYAAAVALRAGEVIVVPTDTVYGIAALPDVQGAAHRIYLAKDRPAHLQLPVLAASLDQIHALGVEFTAAATVLATRWWPGPLTLAFGFSTAATRPPWLAARDEVAVRIPQNDFLLALLRTTGPLLVTSANRHGAPTPASAQEAGQQLAPHVDLAIDAGELDASPSTLVNVHSPVAEVEREGAISRRAVASALGLAQADGA